MVSNTASNRGQAVLPRQSKKKAKAAALPERPKPIKSGQIIRILSVEKKDGGSRLLHQQNS